jgi:autotransporter-associated beta strand protein
MKPRSNPLLHISAALAIGIVCSVQAASPYTWNSNGGPAYDGIWTDATADGWNDVTTPISGDTATITNGTVTTTDNNQQNGVALTIGASGVLNVDAAHYMYFNSTGSLALDSGTININHNYGFYFGWYDGSLSLTVNANSGSSFINGSGGLRLEGNTTFSGAGDLTIGPGLHNYTPGDNSFTATNITKEGVGTLTLSGVNSFTGATTVNGGTLALGVQESLANGSSLEINNGGTVSLQSFNPLGSATPVPVTINSGGLMTMSGGYSVNLRGLTLNGGELSSGGFFDATYGSYYLRDDVIVEAGTTTISAVKITAPGARTFEVASGGTLNVTGSFSSLYGSFGLIKAGPGTMVLSAANDYTGDTLVDEGMLEFSAASSLRFSPITSGVTNAVSGSATATLTFLGTVDLDLSATVAADGNTWTLFDLGSFTGPAPTLTPAAVTSTFGSFTEAPAGTWELPVTGAKWVFTESNGQLAYIVTATDYDTWKTANGVTGGVNDDDDNDGLTNREEYAFGLDPTGGSEANPITSQLNKTTGIFSYTRRLLSLTDLNYTVWYSTDLATWNQDAGAVEGTPAVNSEVETVPVTITNSLLTNSKLFIQVRAE